MPRSNRTRRRKRPRAVTPANPSADPVAEALATVSEGLGKEWLATLLGRGERELSKAKTIRER